MLSTGCDFFDDLFKEYAGYNIALPLRISDELFDLVGGRDVLILLVLKVQMG